MPCDCPENRPRPNSPAECAYLVHSGGPPHGLYRLVDQAIPADVELVHGRPMVHPDGSLEFTGPPPAIPGYWQEGLRLYPAWPPCTLRMLRVQVVNGVLGIAGICGNPEAGQFSLEITTDNCRNCPTRRSP